MVCQPPSCFGMMPKPEHRKLSKGGALNGPRIHLLVHSETRALSKIEGSAKEDCKLLAICANCGPV